MRALSIISLIAATACAVRDRPSADAAAARCEMSDEAGKCVIWGASMIELVARPEKFDGKRVRVIGFVNFQFEGNGLYVSRDDWRNSITRNGVWIDPPSGYESDSAPSRKAPNQNYVIVEGTFNASNHGHMSMWSGAIENVTRLVKWPVGSEGTNSGSR